MTPFSRACRWRRRSLQVRDHAGAGRGLRFPPGVRTIRRQHWWLFAGAVLFGVVVLFIDFEVSEYTDLVPGLAFIAVGLDVLVGCVAAIVAVNLLFHGSLGLTFSPATTPRPVSMGELETSERAAESPFVPDDTPEVRYIYWDEVTPETCHYRLSLTELS